MNIEPGFFVEVLIALAACGGAYAAIRADLARLHERASQALSTANRAHRRIDRIAGQGGVGPGDSD